MWIVALGSFAALLVAVAIYDLTQKRHAILRNFPIIGHFRYWIEAIGPELRQYIVTSNDEERPFSRDQRRWVYTSAKRGNTYFGFGTDNHIEGAPNYLIIKQSAFPLSSPHPGDANFDPTYPLSCHKVLGESRGRKHAFRPSSVVNISAMSFGSLSAAAVQALNRGSKIAGCLHNTGEGGISPHHGHGGDLIWQIGTGYFGCRNEDGSFDMRRLVETVERFPVRAIEVKLSQGAKPGLGGLLPAAKITPEISRIRGVPMGQDCVSPASHKEFSDVDGLLDFVERIAAETGLPVGIKSAVGDLGFWEDLANLMSLGDRGADFITVDGGEGGTGAAPLVFSDHVALPFKLAFRDVFRQFESHNLTESIVFIGSGKLGFPQSALFGFGLGCDLINVAREAMLAIGCIQAQRCHSGHCPTGVATQGRWLAHGLDPTSKADRLANYVMRLRKEILQLSRACGVDHPSKMNLDHFTILDHRLGSRSAAEHYGHGAP